MILTQFTPWTLLRLLRIRISIQTPIIKAINTRAIGMRMARMDITADAKSSVVLTAQFPTPPVVAVTTGRTATDLTACTLPAIKRPAAIASTG